MRRWFIELLVLAQLVCQPAWAGRGLAVESGAELRVRWEQVANGDLGAAKHDGDGYVLSRALVSGAVGCGNFRVAAQCGSMTENGRNGGPRPVDENRADLMQAYAEIFERDRFAAHLRAGRQEIVFGSSRLIGSRDGPNVRQGFDALRLWAQRAGWRVDGFAARPIVTRPGEFDDRPDRHRRIAGIYAVSPEGLLKAGRVDLYLFDYANQRARFARGRGTENRRMIGARFWGETDGLAWDWEAGYQFGRFERRPIEAWALAAETTYAWKRLRMSPKAGLRLNMISGDRRGASLGTFNAFFPSPFFFGETKLVGPANLQDVVVSLELVPVPAVKWTLVAGSFWRMSVRDGIYSYSGALLREAGERGSRQVGSQVSSRIDWRLTPAWNVSLAAAYFGTGRYLREMQVGGMRYLSLTCAYKFS